MNKIIRMINNSLDNIENITTNENIKLFLMSLDADATIVNSEIINNELRLTVEIEPKVFEMIEQDEDKIMDVIGLEVRHNGELISDWKVI